MTRADLRLELLKLAFSYQRDAARAAEIVETIFEPFLLKVMEFEQPSKPPPKAAAKTS